MSTDEFQEIWKAYDAKLERSLALNLRLLKDVQMQKARSELQRLIMTRVLMIVIGAIYETLLIVAFVYVRSQTVMAVSFAVFILCTGLAIFESAKDIAVIRGISYADNVVDTQVKLAGLRSSIIRTLRISWIQLPFWSTFFVSNALIRNGGREFLLIEVPIVMVFSGLAVFLYRNITVENATRKKWVKRMIHGTGVRSVVRAMELMKEIEEFKTG
jgi:hypothetical protein